MQIGIEDREKYECDAGIVISIFAWNYYRQKAYNFFGIKIYDEKFENKERK